MQSKVIRVPIRRETCNGFPPQARPDTTLHTYDDLLVFAKGPRSYLGHCSNMRWPGADARAMRCILSTNKILERQKEETC